MSIPTSFPTKVSFDHAFDVLAQGAQVLSGKGAKKQFSLDIKQLPSFLCVHLRNAPSKALDPKMKKAASEIAMMARIAAATGVADVLLCVFHVHERHPVPLLRMQDIHSGWAEIKHPTVFDGYDVGAGAKRAAEAMIQHDFVFVKLERSSHYDTVGVALADAMSLHWIGHRCAKTSARSSSPLPYRALKASGARRYCCNPVDALWRLLKVVKKQHVNIIKNERYASDSSDIGFDYSWSITLDTLAISTGERNHCDSCMQEATRLLTCSGCMRAKYCSKECQNAHWKADGGHKGKCEKGAHAIRSTTDFFKFQAHWNGAKIPDDAPACQMLVVGK